MSSWHTLKEKCAFCIHEKAWPGQKITLLRIQCREMTEQCNDCYQNMIFNKLKTQIRYKNILNASINEGINKVAKLI